MTDYEGESYTRLTDKAHVIGIEASNYDSERVNHISTVSPDLLRDAAEMLEILSWDKIDIVTVNDERTDNPMVVFTPSNEEFASNNQAGIAIAPKKNDE